MHKHLDLSALRQAMVSLEESLSLVADVAWFEKQSVPVKNTLMAGVIQHFECVYEISIKMLRRHLEIHADDPSSVDHMDFKDLLRTASEQGLVKEVEKWFMYRKMRNITAHTYDHAKAQQVYEGILTFVRDAHDVLASLEKHHG